MDLSNLIVFMDKDSENYIDEYKKQIKAFSVLIDLPKQPEKLIRQTLDFLLRYCNIKSDLPKIITESVHKAKTHKLKTAFITAAITLTYKKLIKSEDLIKLVLIEMHDCIKYINNIKTLIQKEDSEIILKYYKIGNEKQKLFCYYFICFLTTKYDLNLQEFVCQGLFENIKIRKYCYKYFLETIKINSLHKECKKYGEKLYIDITEKKDEREYILYKMRVYVLFRIKYNLKKSIVPLALSMIDPEKEDVKELMSIIIDSVNINEIKKVIKIISEIFCSPYKDDDLICYGLNLMRGLYLKFSNTETKRSQEDSESEASTETIKALGDSEVLKEVRELITNYTECFKGLKTKSVAYAYRSVVNVLKNKKKEERDLHYIAKKTEKVNDDRENQTAAKNKRRHVVKSKQKRKLLRNREGKGNRR